MVETIKVSEKGQIVIPKKMRDRAGIETGDELIVTLRDGNIILWKRPRNYTEYMRGLGKESWKDIDATEYVNKERDAWEKTE